MGFLGIEGKLTYYKNSSIVILPVPFEFSTSYIKGTALGPKKIVEASEQVELYDYEYDTQPFKCGIHTFSEFKPSGKAVEIYFDELEKCHSKVLNDKKFILSLGGEHSITLPLFKSCLNKFKEVGVLHIDAHSDLRDSFEGTKLSHACVMRRIRELTDKTVSVGIRSLCKRDSLYIKKNNAKVFFTEETNLKNKNLFECILNELPEYVYITIDADGFDPSIIPAVGTPEPNGLDWTIITEIIKFVFKNKKVVSADIVELCPRENDINSDFILAKLLYKICSYYNEYNKS